MQAVQRGSMGAGQPAAVYAGRETGNCANVKRIWFIKTRGTDTMRFGEKLSLLRKRRGMTQLELAEEITQARMDRWNQYHELLLPLAEAGKIELPFIPAHCTHNAHMFYLKTKDLEERSRLDAFLKEKNILPASHYVPLHSAPAGIKFGRFHGEDKYTTKESERLLRLPMFYKLTADEVEYIAAQVKAFYQ